MRTTLLAATLLVSACGQKPVEPARTLSLTGTGFAGKKHYFGWAEYLSGFMGNETKYDVRHTNDIFTSGAGGDYKGHALIDRSVDAGDIKRTWDEIAGEMGPEDMYVQYSSGHGYERGLGVGVTYDEIRDNALRYPAKEIVIFTMACHSGGLTESFDRKKSEWQNWAAQGRSLYVLASSREDELSSTGPGTDRDEPGGPNGSAGSAFGHALWKSLIGYSDGYVDGVKDGFISLAEIDGFVKTKSRDIGDQNPVSTGTYNPNLIVNRVPTPRYLESIGLSEAAVNNQLEEDAR